MRFFRGPKHFSPKPKPPPAEIEEKRLQELGLRRNGRVGLRDFDQGVVETLEAFIENDAYWLRVPDMEPPPDMPGVPVTFVFPEDVFKTNKTPLLLVTRGDVTPAMERWHPGTVTYSVPRRGDLPKGVTVGLGSSAKTLIGPTGREQQEQATPYDISYTLTVVAPYRGGVKVHGQANALFTYVLRYYQPYCTVGVRDSVGSLRSYQGFMEGTTSMDEVPGVKERVLGFSVSLRVEGELDLCDPYVVPTVTQPLTARWQSK